MFHSGIRYIIYDEDKYKNTPGVIASKRMLDAAGVKYRKYEHTNREIKMIL